MNIDAPIFILCSSIDDVVINYVMMILTDLIQDEQDEEGHHVEIDQLMELLVAYIPQINQIKRHV